MWFRRRGAAARGRGRSLWIAGWLAAACGGAACAPAPPDVQRSGAIFGGSVDTEHQAVMALLQSLTPTTAYGCSGTTIATVGTSGIFLTAAHCVVAHDAMEAIAIPV